MRLFFKLFLRLWRQQYCLGNQKDDKSLRQELKTYGVDARRLSRFTQLALLGALPLKAYLAEKSGIYLGSPFNSPSKFNKMFHQLTAQNLPSPLDFMALLDLEQDTIPSALVGWVLETDDEQQEGACFWVISKDAKSTVKKLVVLPSTDNMKEKDFLSLVQTALY